MSTNLPNSYGWPPPSHSPEKLLTIADTAAILGVHPWALRRAVKAGTIPAYAPFNGRKLLRVSEVVAAIEASKVGGSDV